MLQQKNSGNDQKTPRVVFKGIDGGGFVSQKGLDVIGAGVSQHDEDALGRRAWEMGRALEVAVLGDQRQAVTGDPSPDDPVSRALQPDIGHVRRARKKVGKAADQGAREVLIEQRPQAVAARSRICSAA